MQNRPKYLLSPPKIIAHNQTQIAKEEEEEEREARSGKIEIRKRRRKGVCVFREKKRKSVRWG